MASCDTLMTSLCLQSPSGGFNVVSCHEAKEDKHHIVKWSSDGHVTCTVCKCAVVFSVSYTTVLTTFPFTVGRVFVNHAPLFIHNW